MDIRQIEIISNSSSQTAKIGEILALEILKEKRKNSLVIGLKGDLGGGKTTFIKGFARGLEIKEKVLSPTFIIFRKYDIKNKNFKRFYHFDCYRVEKEKEILDLGFKEIIFDPKNIIAVEWSEKIEKILPKNSLTVEFEFIDEKKRRVVIREGPSKESSKKNELK